MGNWSVCFASGPAQETVKQARCIGEEEHFRMYSMPLGRNMGDDSHYYNRHSIRLKGYGYSGPGAYFVTIRTQHRECIFGEIVEGEMRLSPVGQIASQCWLEIPKHFPDVELDAHVAMPNHVHGILIIHPTVVGVQHVEPLRNEYQHVIPQSIGSIIRQYKSSVTRLCREQNHNDFRWQRNYYEHIIRNDKQLHNIRIYIDENPRKWYYDEKQGEEYKGEI